MDELWQILVHVDCGHGSVIFRQICDTLCTSDFVVDVTSRFHTMGSMVRYAYSKKWPEHNSRKYCTDSKQTLLKDGDR